MTSFPASLDSLTNPTSGDNLDTTGVLHDVEHSDANDILEALEAKVGVDGSAVTSSLDYRVPGHSYLGYNTVGGTTETATDRRVVAKKFTVSKAGLIPTIDIYVDWSAAEDRVLAINAGLYLDSSDAPTSLVAANFMPQGSLLLDSVLGAGGNTTARWFQVPLGAYVTAADYWAAIQVISQGSTMAAKLYYDGSGSDRYYTSGGNWMSDWGWYTPTTGSNKYSIRASFLG